MTPLDLALEWAGKGYRVFPSTAGSKKPLRKGWKETASDDALEVMVEFEGLPDNTNVLMVIPNDIIVVDLDVKQGANGLKNWYDLCGEHGVLVYGTLAVETPSGGMHCYYKVDRPVAITQSAIAPGIDTRTTDIRDGVTARMSYTLAPGNPGYRAINQMQPAPLPEFVYPLAQPKGRTAKEDFTLQDVADYEWRTDMDELQPVFDQIFKEPFEDGRRDGQITSFAGAAWRQGIDPDTLAEAIADKLNEDGWGGQDWDTIEKCIESVYKNANERPGCDVIEGRLNSMNAIAGLPEDAPPARSKFAHLTYEDLKAQEPPSWLVKGMIPKASMGVLVAPSGSKKTFAALDLAMHMAMEQKEWNGRKLKGSKVLFAAGEGARGIYQRIKGWMQFHERAELSDNMRLVDHVPCGDSPHELIDFVSQDEDFIPDLVVVDTISYASLGLEENSASDMMTLIANYRAAVHGKWPDATVLFIGHAKKDAKDGTTLRGSNAVHGASDFMLGLDDGEDALVLRNTKIKDGARVGECMAFRAEEVQIGQDEDGDPVTTLVLDACEVPKDDVDELANPSTFKWGPIGENASTKVRAAYFHALAGLEEGKAVSFDEVQGEVLGLITHKEGQSDEEAINTAAMRRYKAALARMLKRPPKQYAPLIIGTVAVQDERCSGNIVVKGGSYGIDFSAIFG